VFYYETAGGDVYVCELSRKGDGSYGRLRHQGVRRADYGEFEPWREEV